ncbi:putative ankyrin repeat protein RF_0381 [Patella vulgata]|uniref:putative ankyrin repeat protein RF_0381 n=1 Tax=Patella vulgata TaxID=6465 RepID=UPI0024A8E381|nr:putative ankyrin repeat protein RF_0381 [Patella vulgata]
MMIEAGLDWTNIHTYNNRLCTVIHSGDYKSTSLLLEHGIDVNTVDKNGDKPLALVSQHCETQLVTLLISKDCDINHQNQRGETALHKALQVMRYSHQNRRNVIKILLQNGINPNLSDVEGQTVLFMAVAEQERSITEDLLKAGADVNHCDKRRETPLMIAVGNKDNVMVDVLLKAGADLKPRDILGMNAIFLAALLNNSLVWDVLLKYSDLRSETGSIGNAADEYGITSFMVAAERGPKPMVETLLRAGCNINLQGHGGETPLMFAVDNQDETILSLLLQNGADYNICDYNGQTSLMAAAGRGRKPMVDKLLIAGCNVNLQDHDGKTALMYAVYNKDETILSLLLQNGADYNICDNNGKTALMVGVQKDNQIYCEDLLKAGADVNLSDKDGNTALLIAVRLNNRKIVNGLLKAGADVNLSDDNGKTALMIAARNCNRFILECLLNAGADVNLSDNNGETALMIAARDCNRFILESLLNAGADVNKTDTDGRSAIHGIMVGGDGRGRKWINCLKLLLINRCHVSLDTLFQRLLGKNEEDLVWYLVTENCSLKGLDLSKAKDKFQFPDVSMLSKILFESGAPKSGIENIIVLLVLNTDSWLSTHNPMLGESEDKQQLDEFRDFCKSRSLMSRCRREIGNCIGSGISSKITQVGLPQPLQDYVLMKDFIPKKYFTLVLNDQDDSDARTDVSRNKQMLIRRKIGSFESR